MQWLVLCAKTCLADASACDSHRASVSGRCVPGDWRMSMLEMQGATSPGSVASVAEVGRDSCSCRMIVHTQTCTYICLLVFYSTCSRMF